MRAAETTAVCRVALPLTLSASSLVRPQEVVRTIGGTTMGTSWTAKFAGDEAQAVQLQRLVEQTLDLVISQMSQWDSSSDLSRFHRAAVGPWFPIRGELRTVIEAALQIARESGGAFDPTIGGLVELWGFGAGGPLAVPPRRTAVEQAFAKAGFERLALAVSSNKMRRCSELRLDLSGIAKGYAVDLVTEVLRAHGARTCLVEIGGELKGCGVKPDGMPWWVTLETALPSVDSIRVGLHELAVATSGCERFLEHEGRRYSHTIDPRSGTPIDNGMITATVIHPSCMKADAYATAIMVLGPAEGLRFAERQNLAAVMTCRDGSRSLPVELVTSALAEMLD